jgi:hypothetical protein
MRYIVELEPGVWLAPWTGDPGRTVKMEHAAIFHTDEDAKKAIRQARRYRLFPDAKVVETGEGR